MKSNIKKPTGKHDPEKIIPELPPKRKQRSKEEEEKMNEDEKPIPEIEKTHKHVHKMNIPVAGTKNNKISD